MPQRVGQWLFAPAVADGPPHVVVASVMKDVQVSGRRPTMACGDEIPERLRVLSANLWNGGADPNGFVDLVARVRADVVAVQELTPPQADALGRYMPHGVLEPAHDYNGMG